MSGVYTPRHSLRSSALCRKFLTRILALLRSDSNSKWLTINHEFLKDVRWFHLHAKASIGVNLYFTQLPHLVIECDSSLTGAGGNSSCLCYTWRYTDQHRAKYQAIHQMEAINILVAYRTLAQHHHSEPTSVLILTDNISSSAALMTGRTKDPILGALYSKAQPCSIITFVYLLQLILVYFSAMPCLYELVTSFHPLWTLGVVLTPLELMTCRYLKKKNLL